MRTNLIMGAALLLVSQFSFAQARPAAIDHPIPLKIGIGISNFDSDWNGRISGPTIWADCNLNRMPSSLSGLGLEAEYRDLSFGSPVSRLHYETISGGAIYSFRAHRDFRPYGQFLVGFGSVDFPPTKSGYSHDTRTITEPGVGIDWRMVSRLRIRAGYEYQFWPDLFHGHALNPSGFTIGTSYDFADRGWRTY